MWGPGDTNRLVLNTLMVLNPDGSHADDQESLLNAFGLGVLKVSPTDAKDWIQEYVDEHKEEHGQQKMQWDFCNQDEAPLSAQEVVDFINNWQPGTNRMRRKTCTPVELFTDDPRQAAKFTFTVSKTRAPVQCHACGKAGAGLLKCSACKRVYYCGTECQKTHWQQHKVLCRK
jgi:hypothetical protein